MPKTIHAKIQESCFKNVYWFSRYLLNTDQFGALGKQKETQLLETILILENLLSQENFSEAERLQLFKNTLSNEIKKFCKVGTKNYNLSLNLISRLDEDIMDVERSLVVEEFTNLTENLSRIKIFHSELDDNIMLTAFVQEFERRLGQKRKSRGGQRDVASCWHTTNAVITLSSLIPQARQLFVNFLKVAIKLCDLVNKDKFFICLSRAKLTKNVLNILE